MKLLGWIFGDNLPWWVHLFCAVWFIALAVYYWYKSPITHNEMGWFGFCCAAGLHNLSKLCEVKRETVQ